jgi:hypothetical protein
MTATLLLAMPLSVMWVIRGIQAQAQQAPPDWHRRLAPVVALALICSVVKALWYIAAFAGLVALVALWRAGKPLSPLPTARSWKSIALLCRVQCSVGLALAFFALVLTLFYSGRYPEPSVQDSTVFDRISATDMAARLESIATEEEIDAAASWVDSVPSVHDIASVAGLNPFAWSHLLSFAYVGLAAFILVGCVLRRDLKTAGLGRRLLAITVSYFAVGFAFALLYHAIYAGQVGKYNWFVRWYFDLKGETAKRSVQSNDQVLEQTEWKTGRAMPPPGGEDWRGGPLRGVIGLIRARIQTRSVFAQDKPKFVIDPAQPQGVEVFWATFLFATGKDKLELGRIFELNKSGGVPSNAAERDRFLAFLGSFTPGTDRLISPIYRVRLIGGADSRPFARGEADAMEGDPHLARDRAEALRRHLRDWVLESSSAPSQHLIALTAAFEHPDINDYIIQGKERSQEPEVSRKLQALWPRRRPPVPADNQDLDRAQWRAASVTISRVDPDPAMMRASMEPSGSTLEDMLYFSFVSFTTTGYGDIRPVSGEARAWVIIENVIEVFFAGIFFAAVVRA